MGDTYTLSFISETENGRENIESQRTHIGFWTGGEVGLIRLRTGEIIEGLLGIHTYLATQAASQSCLIREALIESQKCIDEALMLLRKNRPVKPKELEKALTMPVKDTAINSFGTSIGACPNCGARVIRNYNENNCGRCGQNIKWE